MSQPKPKEPDNTKITSKLPQRIPILYVWYGKTVPEDYLISLSELEYPIVFMKDADLNRKFSRQIMDIEKSDYYRLQYLYEHGGIYSDLDNVINYDCLMKLLEPYRNQDKLVFMTDGRHTRAKIKQMTTNLIFAPYPKMPILKKMLDQVDERKGKIWGFAGMRHVAKYSQPLEVNMDKCVKHIGDWSWFEASNKVLRKTSGPNSKFRNKLTKKKDIIHQNDNLNKQLQREKAQKKKLNMNLNKLSSQYKKIKQEIDNIKKNETKKKVSSVTVQAQNPGDIKNNPSEGAPKAEQIGFEWTKEKITMQNQIQQLSSQNQHLQFERNASLFAVGGSILILLVLMIIGIKIFRRKNPLFSQVGSTEKTIVQQMKQDSC